MSLREADGTVFLEWTVDMRAEWELFPGAAGKRAAKAAKGWEPGTIDAGADPIGRGFAVASAAMAAERSEECGLGPLRMRVWLERREGADEIWRIECSAELRDPARLGRLGVEGLKSDGLEANAADLLLRGVFRDPETSDKWLSLDGWNWGDATPEAKGMAALEKARLERCGASGIGRGKPRGM